MRKRHRSPSNAKMSRFQARRSHARHPASDSLKTSRPCLLPAAVPPSTPDGAFGLGLLGVWVMGGLAGAGVGALAGYIAAQ